MTRKQSQQHDAQRKPSWRVRWKTMSRAVGMEIREHKSSFAVYVVLRMLVLAMAYSSSLTATTKMCSCAS